MSLKKFIPQPVKIVLRSLLDKVPLSIEARPPRPEWPGEKHRFNYQQSYVDFDIKPTDRVLDIGSGGDPFPYANVLVDRFVDPTPHRYGSLVQNGKPLISADIHELPFRDKCFDFVYCVHILEHVEDPIKACAEIMRVGKRGYLETPSMSEDILFAWAKDRHKWHVVAINQTLCFFEYTDRQLEGIRSTAWENIIMDKRYHPLQQAYFENRDIFDVMLSWNGEFAVLVFYLSGKIESLNARISD